MKKVRNNNLAAFDFAAFDFAQAAEGDFRRWLSGAETTGIVILEKS